MKIKNIKLLGRHYFGVVTVAVLALILMPTTFSCACLTEKQKIEGAAPKFELFLKSYFSKHGKYPDTHEFVSLMLQNREIMWNYDRRNDSQNDFMQMFRIDDGETAQSVAYALITYGNFSINVYDDTKVGTGLYYKGSEDGTSYVLKGYAEGFKLFLPFKYNVEVYSSD